MGEIQYAPVPPYKPPHNDAPDWLVSLMRWLADLLAPLGRWLGAAGTGSNWRSRPLRCSARRGSAGACCQRWRLARALAAPAPASPMLDRAAALALLEDADAAGGSRAAMAKRCVLLLQRSVHHIAIGPSGLAEPSRAPRARSARIPGLPGRARQALRR